MRPRSVSVVVALCLIAVAASSKDKPAVAYPEGYRDWSHVKSMVLEEGHPLYASFGGIHHIYANDKAMKGYRSGRFADGSVIVFDLLEAASADHAIAEGARKVVGVMQKDARRFASTGGWGFEGFAAGDPANPVVGESAATACFECHTAQKDHNYVFSSLRD